MTSKSKQHWLGKVAIYVDQRTKEPTVAYIDDVTTDGYLIAYFVNVGGLQFANEIDLLEFDYHLYRKLRSDWKLKDLKRQVQSIELGRSV